MKEIWKSIDETDGYYDVSNLGRVRRAKSGGVNTYAGKILKPYNNGRDHWFITFRWMGINKKRFYIHVLVARYFIGKRSYGCEVNHIDCNGFNNRVDNLEYISHLGNVRHARANGLYPSFKGELNPSAKLKAEDVDEIRRLYRNGYYQYEIGELFAVTQAMVSLIVRRENWA